MVKKKTVVKTIKKKDKVVKPKKVMSKQEVFDKAMELGQRLLLENQPRISKQLDKEISELEKMESFKKITEELAKISQQQPPRVIRFQIRGEVF